MDGQREDGSTTRTETAGDGDRPDAVTSRAAPDESTAGTASDGGDGGTVAHRVPAPRGAPDDAPGDAPRGAPDDAPGDATTAVPTGAAPTTPATTSSTDPGGPGQVPRHGPGHGDQSYGGHQYGGHQYGGHQHGGHQHGGHQHGQGHGGQQYGGQQYGQGHGGQQYGRPAAWGPAPGTQVPPGGGPGQAPPGHHTGSLPGSWGGAQQGSWSGPQQAPGWGGPPPWGPPPGDQADPPPRGRGRTIILAAIALVVVAVLVVVTIVIVDGARTRRAVTTAADDVASWPGVTYRGQVDDGLGGPASVEMTVDGQGVASGTITRAAGGRADFVLTRTNRAIRGDEAWWRTSAPRPRLATKLGGVWLSGADDQLAAVSGWAVSPGDLSRSVAGRPWSGDSSRPLGPVQGDVLADGDDRITLDDNGDVPRLAEVELAGFGRQRTSPVAATRATPDALGAVGTAATGVPTMPAFRAAVSSTPLAFSRIDPIPDCFTAQCPVTVRVLNIGRYRTTGTLQVLQNDAPAASFPFDAAPGANLVFTAVLQNQAFTTNTASVTTRVTARLSDLE